MGFKDLERKSFEITKEIYSEKAMEDTKYYTPEIEEFHVGFDFDVEDHGHWRKGDFHELDLYKKFNDYTLRVKHLDREDIESLGFKADICPKKYGVPTNMWNKGSYTLTKWGDRVLIKINGDYDGEKFHYFGIIKNKSELKRILTQIGVLKSN